MKCSHGLDFEVKCRGCFEDAMKRVSASQKDIDSEEVRVSFSEGNQKPVDSDPRLL
jgi:hypothetical protein